MRFLDRLAERAARYFAANPETFKATVDALERWATPERPGAEPSPVRTKRGRTQAKPSLGGRPRVVFSLERARRLLDAGESTRSVAKSLGISPRTLRRYLE